MSEAWRLVWGSDSRYYARRSDGACFTIDGSARVVDLAGPDGAAPPKGYARAVPSIPRSGRYALRVFADDSDARRTRVVACGVRRLS